MTGALEPSSCSLEWDGRISPLLDCIVGPGTHFGPKCWRVFSFRIPCDMDKVPLYSRSTSDGELWVMLVEKAYAKMHGCYENIAQVRVEGLELGITGQTTEPLASNSQR